MCGTLSAIRLKSSRSNATPASFAMANKCNTALVLPPNAFTTAMAFSKAFLVMMSRGRIPKRSKFTTASPARRASSSRLRSIAGADADPGKLIPIASAIDDIVLAVNMPPHAPSPGHAARSISVSSSSVIVPAAHAPTASNTVVISMLLPLYTPGMVEPLYTNTLAKFKRAAAINMAGMDLSQPASPTKPSKRSPCTTVSTLSVITSRETKLARIPSCPIEIPSDTVMVPNSSATPPASRTPAFADSASRRNDMLHGVTSFHADAIPICGFTQSSSVRPTARNMARAAAFWMPSVTSRLRGLISMGVPVGSVAMPLKVVAQTRSGLHAQGFFRIFR